tara:strand:+ start:202 stop:504 length:303 start_codon:yes stop_codon:yes gene_type:complete
LDGTSFTLPSNLSSLSLSLLPIEFWKDGNSRAYSWVCSVLKEDEGGEEGGGEAGYNANPSYEEDWQLNERGHHTSGPMAQVASMHKYIIYLSTLLLTALF